jgi:hypothetical protein
MHAMNLKNAVLKDGLINCWCHLLDNYLLEEVMVPNLTER